MISITATLEAAQQSASTSPYPKVEIFNRVGGISRLDWEELWSGAGTDYYHDCCIAGDGSLLRIWTDESNDHIMFDRVANPDEDSDYSNSTDTGRTGCDVSICAYGATVYRFYVDDTAYIYWSKSTDYGASWGSWDSFAGILTDDKVRISATCKVTDQVRILLANINAYGFNDYIFLYYTDNGGTSWTTVGNWDHSAEVDYITGVAIYYYGDYNIIVTGTEATTERPCVWQTIYGDGYIVAAGNWGSLKEIEAREADSDFSFAFPTLEIPDVWRIFYVESYAGDESYDRPSWTLSLGTADFNDNRWRESVPFNLTSEYGLALANDATHAWLTRIGKVYRAPVSPSALDISADVLSLKSEAFPGKGSITIALRNDDGRYGDIGTGDYANIKLGSEIRFSPGYRTTEGIEVCAGPAFWIESWDYISKGGSAVFLLHGADGWGILDAWRSKHQVKWDAEDSSIYQIMAWLFARVGLELSTTGGSSTALTSLKPAFTLSPGESARTAVLRLLSKVEDVLFFRGYTGYLTHPESDDSTDYTYGPDDHPILEAVYSRLAMETNRARVIGDGVFTEDIDWDELALVYDRSAQVHDIYLDTTTEAHYQGVASLRASKAQSRSGYLLALLNTGQELFDVVEINDSRAGLEDAKRRVLGLVNTYHSKKAVYTSKITLGEV